MKEGKRRRLELIRELRASHALQEAEQKLKAEEKKQVHIYLYNCIYLIILFRCYLLDRTSAKDRRVYRA